MAFETSLPRIPRPVRHPQPGPKMTMMTAFFKPSSVPAKGRLPGEDDDEEGGEGREETPGADEEEENLDDE